MKNLFKIAAAFGLAFTLSSCGTANDIYGNNYPNTRYPNSNTRYPSNNGVYRTNDGNVYRQGEIYRDRNGNIYQNGRVVRRSDVYGRPGVISRNGNVYSGNSRRIPPGQAKKIYGGNARDYARGQSNKKVTQRYPSNSKNQRFEDRDDNKKGKFKNGKGKKAGRR